MPNVVDETADLTRRSLDIEDVLTQIAALRSEMVALPAASQARIEQAHADFRASARNLLEYLVLRRRDLRPLQLQLASLGLSSLGRAESHVLATVDAVLAALHSLMGHAWHAPEHVPPVVNFSTGEELLTRHADQLFGPARAGRRARIMVTMPSEAADDYLLVRDLLQQGMDCMRINCAHDDPAAWLRMIKHLRRAEHTVGRSCRVVMDLAGPKLRTGPLSPGPAVVRIRPRRDVHGRVVALARVWLTAEEAPQPAPSPADASLSVPNAWLRRLQVGERIRFVDARDAARAFVVVDVAEHGCWVEASKTSYIVPGIMLRHERRVGEGGSRKAPVGDLPRGEEALFLRRGDTLLVTRDLKPGRPATRDGGGEMLSPATIGCSIPEVFDDVQSGDSIWFDDGKIGGIVEKVEASQVRVRITHVALKGEKLRADKGINLPDSNLHLGAMTAKDVEDLPFVARHADVVELSFANTAQDVEQLQEHLQRLGRRQPAIVLKIETRRGFEHLPDMLLTAMRAPCCGVMIARGDLAVECGFERLAEVQEEILWISEAAHVPVIWATQVLETLAKEGIASRAEITDAAMGHRAECVMLNKGPYVVNAVRTLDDILGRMQGHQAKKQSMLRELQLAHALSATISVVADGPMVG